MMKGFLESWRIPTTKIREFANSPGLILRHQVVQTAKGICLNWWTYCYTLQIAFTPNPSVFFDLYYTKRILLILLYAVGVTKRSVLTFSCQPCQPCWSCQPCQPFQPRQPCQPSGHSWSSWHNWHSRNSGPSWPSGHSWPSGAGLALLAVLAYSSSSISNFSNSAVCSSGMFYRIYGAL